LIRLSNGKHEICLKFTLRCVAKSQKSFALGIQWLMVRLIGTIPAPIIFGSLIDSSCILWQNSYNTGDRGSCLVYDNRLMSKYMLLLVICSKLVTCASIIGSWLLYKPPTNISSSNSIVPIVPIQQISGTNTNLLINCDNLLFKPQSLSQLTDSNGYVDYIITNRL
jgi:organic anion transporter 4A